MRVEGLGWALRAFWACGAFGVYRAWGFIYAASDLCGFGRLGLRGFRASGMFLRVGLRILVFGNFILQVPIGYDIYIYM